MRVAVLFSGGKDSTYALGWAMQQGFECVLLTVKPPEYSMMFHHPNVAATELQAEAVGLTQMIVETTEENWRAKVVDALKLLDVEGIVTGAVASTYQKTRIDSIAKELGIQAFSPLWHKDRDSRGDPEYKTLERMLEDFEIYVTAVSADGLGPEFLGEPFKKLVDSLRTRNPKPKTHNPKPAIHPFLEGGEGETFVTDAPFFKKRINVKRWKKSWDGVRGVAEIEHAELVTKC